VRLRQFAVLFICNAVPLFIGMGLFPVLPLYAAQLGASRTDIGVYYAVVYVASAVSVLLTGWLAGRVPRRRLFLAGATLGIPALALMGHVTALWQLVALTAIVWFCGGVTLTLLSVFTGILADGARRGRVFSLMFLVYPLDALIGGGAVGELIARFGYTPMFYALAAIWTIQPVVGMLGLRDSRITRPAAAAANGGAVSLGRPFALLLLTSLLGAVAINVGRLGTALSMQTLSFSPEAVASTAIVSGLATIPLTAVIGTLSDRFGRRAMLALSYLLAAAGTGLLIGAAALWQFQLAATLLLAAWCVSRAVASALGTDLLAPEALSRGLSRLGSTDSIASIAGFAAAGVVMDALGGASLYVAATAFALAAAVSLVPPRRGAPSAASQAALAPAKSAP
jgi:MFS family permease